MALRRRPAPGHLGHPLPRPPPGPARVRRHPAVRRERHLRRRAPAARPADRLGRGDVPARHPRAAPQGRRRRQPRGLPRQQPRRQAAARDPRGAPARRDAPADDRRAVRHGAAGHGAVERPQVGVVLRRAPSGRYSPAWSTFRPTATPPRSPTASRPCCARPSAAPTPRPPWSSTTHRSPGCTSS